MIIKELLTLVFNNFTHPFVQCISSQQCILHPSHSHANRHTLKENSYIHILSLLYVVKALLVCLQWLLHHPLGTFTTAQNRNHK